MISDFASGARQTLEFLHARLGFNLWMVTRTEGDDWIVLDANDHGYRVEAGDIFRWADSYCSRMTAGLGPRIAPDAKSVPAYFSAEINRQVDIGAYIGVPLTRGDGSFFGTLCGIDPTSKPDHLIEEQPLVELLAGLLSALLAAELRAEDARRHAEQLGTDATRDALTSLYNRRGWDTLVENEEGRSARYGHPAAVISIDLDGLKERNDTLGHQAGDALLITAAEAIKRATRTTDIVARLGGDEFAVLGVECNLTDASMLLDRLRREFEAAGIAASIGFAMRRPKEGIAKAYASADAAMYEEKRRRKGGDARS